MLATGRSESHEMYEHAFVSYMRQLLNWRDVWDSILAIWVRSSHPMSRPHPVYQVMGLISCRLSATVDLAYSEWRALRYDKNASKHTAYCACEQYDDLCVRSW